MKWIHISNAYVFLCIAFSNASDYDGFFIPDQQTNVLLYSNNAASYFAACSVAAAASTGVYLDTGESSLSIGIGYFNSVVGSALLINYRCNDNVIVSSNISIGVSKIFYDTVIVFSIGVSTGDFV